MGKKTKIKNSMDEIYSKLDITEERINEPEDTQNKSPNLKHNWKNNEQILCELGKHGDWNPRERNVRENETTR